MTLKEPDQLDYACCICGSKQDLMPYMFYGDPAYICPRCKDEGLLDLLEDEEIQATFISKDLNDGFLER